MITGRNVKLTIAYEGTAYHGWQRQKNQDVPTVQGTLEAAWRALTGETVRIRGASRTDAGVHAAGQVADVVTETAIPTPSIPAALNGRLPEDIVILSAEDVPPSFHASRNAISKMYHYRIYNAPVRSVESYRRRLHIPYPLDVEKMDQAGKLILGHHDCAAFASAKDERDTTVRTILQCNARRADEHEIVIEVQADRFLYNMVRNIVGTLIEIGRGHWPVEQMASILAGADRRNAGPTAPPHGLCLQWIRYGPTDHANAGPALGAC